jgi:hypothetical protein
MRNVCSLEIDRVRPTAPVNAPNAPRLHSRQALRQVTEHHFRGTHVHEFHRTTLGRDLVVGGAFSSCVAGVYASDLGRRTVSTGIVPIGRRRYVRHGHSILERVGYPVFSMREARSPRDRN